MHCTVSDVYGTLGDLSNFHFVFLIYSNFVNCKLLFKRSPRHFCKTNLSEISEKKPGICVVLTKFSTKISKNF